MPSRTFIRREEKSTPGFKASRDRLTLLLQANAAGDFNLNLGLIYRSRNSRGLRNYAEFTLPVLWKWNNKAWMTARMLTTWFTEYFKPIVRPTAQKKDFFQNMLIDYAPGHSRALMEMYNVISMFMLANTTSILQPMCWVVLTFKSYYLKNIFCKAMAAIDSDSSVGLGRVNWEPSGKGWPF